MGRKQKCPVASGEATGQGWKNGSDLGGEVFGVATAVLSYGGDAIVAA